jgi:hypothetical protein
MSRPLGIGAHGGKVAAGVAVTWKGCRESDCVFQGLGMARGLSHGERKKDMQLCSGTTRREKMEGSRSHESGTTRIHSQRQGTPSMSASSYFR